MAWWRRKTQAKGQRRALVATAAGAASIALVAGIAVVAQGYERSEQDLSDASVWVTNTDKTLLGHANTAISALSTAIKLEGDGLTVAQDAGHVVMHVPEKNTLSLIDPAQAQAVASVNLPTGKPQVVSSGGYLGILDPAEGDVWVRSLGDLQGFDAMQDSDGQAGVDAVLAVDASGRWAGFSQKASRVSVGSGGSTEVADVAFSTTPRNAQVTLIGGEAAVFNPASNEVWFKGRVHSLNAVVTDPESVRLQAPSLEAGDVALAHNGGLAVALADKDQVDLPVSGVEGLTAAPQRVGDCLYAAWGSQRATQWCQGRDPETFPLRGGIAVRSLVLRSNEDVVVANDPATGATWALQNGGALINNWDDFTEQSKQVERQRDDLDVPPEPETAPKPPQAKDDTFGARAGRANLLPVLLNDTDPNGDPLIVSDVKGIDPTRGTVQIAENGQKLQLTPREDATGSFALTYTITDGHGGKASATATVTLAGAGENKAPEQVRPSKTSLALEGRASIGVLDDWVDPESDPMYLVSATMDAPTTAASTPEGRVDVTQGGGDPGVEQARIRVSDGTDSGDGTLSVTVHPKGKAPVIAESYTLSGFVGNEIATLPLQAARGGTGELSLAQVNADDGSKDALKVSASYSDGKVRIVPSQPGTHRVSYTVRDAEGKETAVGVIRVDVRKPPEGSTAPVVSPTTAFVYLNNTTDVDVLANAYDPGGKVLSIAEVGGADEAGIKVESVEREHLRVLLTRDVASPQKLKVVISNGTERTSGDLIIVRVPEPTKEQAPVARDDVVKARAGDVADIPVLANDTQADGKPITLVRDLVQSPKAGLLVSAGDRLRYLAPDTPGTYTARYQITSASGLTATGSVRIDVLGRDEAGNREPSAPTVTARTTAGQTVKVQIPLAGTDPDGDSVSINGVEQQPGKGAVSFDGDVMEYTANPASVGTDTFTYQLVDSLGAASTGTVRVGIDAASTATAPPVAQDDLITTRPGTPLAVDVTANDTDNARAGLRVSVDRVLGEGAKPVVDGKRITFTTPSRQGTVAVLYTVTDKVGLQSQAWMYVDVRRDAPLAAPTTQDRRLSLSDIEGKDRIQVPVLETTAFTEGPVSSLDVAVPEGYGEAKVLPGGVVEVPVGDNLSVVPFTVSRPDAPEIGATSFITVPGRQHAKPELRKNPPELTVESGEELAIPLAQHVIAAENRPVTLANTKSLSASNGEVSGRGNDTLLFRSSPDFWGQANVSFTVTDGRESAQLTLKITVTSKKDQPPTLKDASIALESGASHTTDLRALTEVAGGATQEQGLSWSATGGDKDLVTYEVVGDKLQLTAVKGDTVGRTTTLNLRVEDAKGLSAQATATVTISRSQKALPRAQDDTATLRRGDSVTVDVLSNDVSPYEDGALRVVSVRTESIVNGVNVVSGDGDRKVVVSAADDSDTGVTSINYTIQDSTGDPTRRAVGTLRVTIQDVPDAPAQAPGIAEQRPKDRAVVLSVPGADANGSPIKRYDYRTNGGEGPSGSCSNPQACEVKGLDYAKDYSFQMRAVNELGEGGWSPKSASVNMDQKPNAPAGIKGTPSDTDRSGHTLMISWQPPSSADWGSALKSYQLKVTGTGVNTVRSVGADTTSLTFKDDGVRPGQRYVLTVSATNQSNQSSESVSGEVTAVGAPTISGAQAGISGGGTKVEATWKVDDGGRAVRARVVPSSEAGSCSPDGNGYSLTGTSWSKDLKPGDETSFTVQVSNGLFCDEAKTSKVDVNVAEPRGEVDARKTEGQDGKYGTDPRYRVSAGGGDFTFVNVSEQGSKPGANGGGWAKVQPGDWEAFGADGQLTRVWAMSCRSGERTFCSDVVKIGEATRDALDIGFKVTGQDKCPAYGDPWKVRVTADASGAKAPKLEYKVKGVKVGDNEYSWTRIDSGQELKLEFGLTSDKITVEFRSSGEFDGKKRWYPSEGGMSFSCKEPEEPEADKDKDAEANATKDANKDGAKDAAKDANATSGSNANATTSGTATSGSDANATANANAGTTDTADANADAASGGSATASTSGTTDAGAAATATADSAATADANASGTADGAP